MTQQTIQEQIQSSLESGKPVLIKASASWCHPCKTIAPVVDKLQTELQDEVTIISVDVDEEPKFCAEKRIRGVPTFIWIDTEKEVSRTGLTNKNLIEKFIEEMKG